MRGKKQIAKRAQRAAIANELLAWFKKQGITGANLSYPYVDDFARDGHHELFESWKAWDLLREAGRIASHAGPGWKILDFTPIALDDNGGLVRNV